ncbi:MAG: hypothetical protein CFE22_09955 [Cytophagaceae bacterium BCCC1]|nr:MAG: hypothetical protein CFE22_09955 [Cytophagaceae bacterium BCCC1]
MKTRIKILPSILFLLLLTSCEIISAGSYPYREEYVFENVQEKELIDSIVNIGKQYKDLNVPAEHDFSGGYPDERKLWYYVYYMNPKTSNIFFFFIQQKSKKESYVGLVSVVKVTDLYNWQEVNHDLKGNENKKAKEEFETLILDKIGLKYRKRTFWENIGF